jgi:L-arabinonolactonase
LRAEVECITSFGNDLGESLQWDADAGLVYWIDAWKCLVHTYDPVTGYVGQIDFARSLDGRPIGSIALCDDGALISGVKGGFYRLDTRKGEGELLATVERQRPPTNRLNDGKCDRRGRFWCASINTDRHTRSGALWRFDCNRVPCLIDDGLQAGNGIAWSPDNRILYLADSFLRRIWQYDFDLESGEVENRRLFVSTETLGVPDGATVDADGCYWTALFQAGAVARFDPDGTLMQRIELPVTYPTMCSFGGGHLDTLYVTSASRFSDEAIRAAEPQTGRLFAIRGLGVRGRPDAKFRM